MARRPGITQPPLGRLSTRDITAIGKLASAPASSTEFGKAFAADPEIALAAKGIELAPGEADRIKAELGRLGGSHGANAKTEVGIKVTVKF